MKVLVSTVLTQGQRKNDFCHVPPGELVTFGSECDREPVDGKCGCRRCLIGMTTNKGTTTFRVVDSPVLTPKSLEDAVKDHLEKTGWAKLAHDGVEEWVKQDAKEIVRIAEAFPTGTILERRGQTFRERRAE
jgi:hypothetical protein